MYISIGIHTYIYIYISYAYIEPLPVTKNPSHQKARALEAPRAESHGHEAPQLLGRDAWLPSHSAPVFFGNSHMNTRISTRALKS